MWRTYVPYSHINLICNMQANLNIPIWNCGKLYNYIPVIKLRKILSQAITLRNHLNIWKSKACCPAGYYVLTSLCCCWADMTKLMPKSREDLFSSWDLSCFHDTCSPLKSFLSLTNPTFNII